MESMLDLYQEDIIMCNCEECIYWQSVIDEELDVDQEYQEVQR